MTSRKQLAFSVLDLAPVAEGSTPADALRNSLDLAQQTEKFGYTPVTGSPNITTSSA